MTKAPAINLAWHDACNASRVFVVADSPVWPDAMTPAQLAAMQRPVAFNDTQERLSECRALCGALEAACQAGELEYIAETKPRGPIDRAVFEALGCVVHPCWGLPMVRRIGADDWLFRKSVKYG